MRTNKVLGNWKMNLTYNDAMTLAQEMTEALANTTVNCEVGFFVPSPYINDIVTSKIGAYPETKIGFQNANVGTYYTGVCMPDAVANCGVAYNLVGQAECRNYLGITSEVCSQQIRLFSSLNIPSVYCVGENLEERETGQTNSVLNTQLTEGLSGLSAEEMANTTIAYEPVWTVGTGKTCLPTDVEEACAYIRSLISEKYGQEMGENTSILYGGSLKPSNAPELFGMPNIDGGLVGGASLKVADFMGIVEAYNR